MLQDLYQAIVKDSTFAFTYNRIVCDESGKPVDYVFLDANSVYAGMIGLPVSGIVNRRVSEVLSDLGEDPFDWIEFFGRTAQTGEKQEIEQYSRNLERWFHLSVTCPDPGYFVVFSYDITDKKEAERSLVLSEERNRRYINSAPIGIFILNGKGIFLQVNPAGCAMLGYETGELPGYTVADLSARGELETNLAAFRARHGGGDGRSRRAFLRKKDSSRLPVMLDSVPLAGDLFMAFCTDITGLEMLAREKEQYYTAFQSMSQPVVITTRDGTITEINRAFTEMYGFSRQETVGANPRLLNPGFEVYAGFGYTEEEYRGNFGKLWEYVRNPSVRTWEGMVINRRKDGSLVWVQLQVNGVYDGDGRLDSIIGIPVDITHTHEKEDRIRLQLYQTIADLAELRDDQTGNHMKRVGIFTRLLAKGCGMNGKFCTDIEIFSPMHDIGKVGIHDSILRAPRKLTDEEFAVMKTHTTLGHNIVKEKKLFEMAAEITLYHHERWDGTGYPTGLSGKAIPLAAQITSLADVYDALRSRRPYKEPWSHADAVAYILGNSGSSFDPDLVAVFRSLHTGFETVYGDLMS